MTATLERIAAERGIDYAPIPDPVAAALPSLIASVQQLAEAPDAAGVHNRQWLAAALAALSSHVQLTTLPNAGPRPDPAPGAATG